MRAARAAPRLRAPWARLGLANLYRPGSSTPLMLVSVGLGLSTLAAVALIQGNVRQQVLDQVPANAPSFFFVDIQNDQLPRFEALVGAQPGVSESHQMPSLRARIVSVDGVPADQVKATPDTRWALRGDRGLTYSADAARGHAARRRALVAGRLPGPAAALLRRRPGEGLGHRRRRHHPGQRAGPRHRPQDRKSA